MYSKVWTLDIGASSHAEYIRASSHAHELSCIETHACTLLHSCAHTITLMRAHYHTHARVPTRTNAHAGCRCGETPFFDWAGATNEEALPWAV